MKDEEAATKFLTDKIGSAGRPQVRIGFRASIIAVFVAVVLLVGLTPVYLSFDRVSSITRTAQKMFSSREWKRLYADGTVVKWLQQVSDFFMSEAGDRESTKASDYFDPTIYLSTIG